MLTFGSLFTGFGGMDLGLERAGFVCKWQVENEPYAIRVLEKHWPHVRRWDDARSFPPCADATGLLRKRKRKERDGALLQEWGCDIIAGGFPCQPVSCAGKRQAQSDPRWLWPHFARIIRVLRPRYVLLENVPGLFVHGFGDVLGSLAEMGFDAEWVVFPACAFGAPHPRERVFIVAYSMRGRFSGSNGKSKLAKEHCSSRSENKKRAQGEATANGNGNEARIFRAGGEIATLPMPCWGSDQPGVVRASYGISNRMERIRGLGNAVVPAQAEFIGRQLLQHIQGETT